MLLSLREKSSSEPGFEAESPALRSDGLHLRQPLGQARTFVLVVIEQLY